MARQTLDGRLSRLLLIDVKAAVDPSGQIPVSLESFTIPSGHTTFREWWQRVGLSDNPTNHG